MSGVIANFRATPRQADGLRCLESEAALLGAVLIENGLIDDLGQSLTADDFAEPVHRRLWAAILDLRSNGKTANPATLASRFGRDDDMRELGGTGYLFQPTADGQGLLAPRELAEQISELSLRRRIRAAGQQLIDADANSASGAELLSQASEALAALSNRSGGASASPYQWRDPATIPPRRWAIGRWFLLSTVACVLAPGGAGKSTFISSLAVSLCTGRDLLGKPVWGGRKRVWIWNLEDEADELDRSLSAVLLHHDIEPTELDGWLFVDCGLEREGLCTAKEDSDGFRLLRPVYAAIEAELRRRRIDVLVIDPFVSSHEVDENHNGRIDAIAKAWARVAHRTGCLIILAHHVAKNGSGEVTAHSSRGAVSLPNAARSTVVLNRMEPGEADRLGISQEERRRYVRIGDDKHNRAPAEAADWFKFESVQLGNDTEALPGDNVGVLTPWSPPDPFADVSVATLRQVQGRCADKGWRESPQSPDWIGHLVAEVLDVDLGDRAGQVRVKAILAEWIRNGALRIEERPDARRQLRKFVVSGEPT